jgi:drug/metabolite transporter (DMT)-like permease
MEPVQYPMRALGLRLLAVVVLSTLIMLVKYTASTGVHFAEILFWRQLPVVVILFGWLALRGEVARLKTKRLRNHAGRAVTGMIGMVCTFGAPIILHLAEATTLAFTTPLFAVVLSALLLKERIGPWRWLAVGLGFVGVLVIAQPGGSPLPALGAALGLGGGFMVALISIQIRDLARTEEPIAVVFWFSLISVPVYALLQPFFATAHSPTQWVLLISGGVLGCIAQLLLTASLRYGQVASVIVMDYTALIWSTLYGWLIWDDLPAAVTWLGAPLIIAAGTIIAWREHRLSKAAPPTAPFAAD